MVCLFPTYYPGHNKLSVKLVNKEYVMINGIESHYQNSSKPITDDDFGSKLYYAGTISVRKHFNYTGPKIIIGRRECNGQFRINNELLNLFKCNPYCNILQETAIIDNRPSFMIIEII